MMPLEPLPVDDVLAELIAALRAAPCAVLQAPTGAGKTTRVPPALLDAGLAGSGQILMLEPRRIAARAAARRIASERGVRLGEEVGYQVRFDRCASQATRILVATPGILLQTLHANPFIEHIGMVIFDEFHERGLECDLALGLVRLIQQAVRNDLKLVAMSATIAAKQVATYLGNCPVVVSDGRLHPVEIRYESKPPASPWPAAAAESVRRLLPQTPGDVLVFLPGMYEIRQTARELEGLAAKHDLAILPLHGDLPPAEQDAALAPQDRRKIVLATNVAETSVTVQGVTAVVDTGLARQMDFDRSVGLDRLSIVNISQASADQRAGRAGRERPGLCVRLWTESSHKSRLPHTAPEIVRIDLTGAVLQLLAMGEKAPEQFGWLEPPPTDAVTRSLELLRELGAIGDGITDLGHAMARLPVHPRLARMLIEGASLGQARRVALAAALLAERDPFRRMSSAARVPSESDLLDRIEILEAFERDGRFESPLGELDRGAARFVLLARDQLARSVERLPATIPASGDEAVLRAVLAAFPDRVCKRRNPGGRKAVAVGGRGARLDNRSAVTRPTLFVAVDVDAGQEETLVRIASGIEREWLPERLVQSGVETGFDESTGRVQAWRRTRYLDLVIDESPTAPPEGADVRLALAAAAKANFATIKPTDDSPAGQWRLRVRCLRAWRPQLELLEFADAELMDMLDMLASSCHTLGEMKNADWLGMMHSKLSRDQLLAVDREAPERITVPSGSSVPITYAEGRPPVLAVRIQELFGLRETPRIAGGSVPILLHLLAPNYRPQQVTDDLASFWANTYPVVRKELRVKYPKHAWPEDPLTASPQNKPGRKS